MNVCPCGTPILNAGQPGFRSVAVFIEADCHLSRLLHPLISIHAAIEPRHVGLNVLTPALFAARRKSSSRVAIGAPLRRASSRYDAS
jgi:hypothetical protein